MVYGPLPLTLETVLIVQTSLIVLFNSTVWSLFLKRRNLRNKSNYFIASLSASHLFLWLFGISCYVSSRRKMNSTLVLRTEVFYYFLCSSILNMYLPVYLWTLSVNNETTLLPSAHEQQVCGSSDLHSMAVSEHAHYSWFFYLGLRWKCIVSPLATWFITGCKRLCSWLYFCYLRQWT